MVPEENTTFISVVSPMDDPPEKTGSGEVNLEPTARAGSQV